MRAAKGWAKAVSTDLVMFGLLYGWLVIGSEGAENAFKFIFWALLVLHGLVIGASACDARPLKDATPRPRGMGAYHFVTEFVLILVLAWFGHSWMAGLRLTTELLLEGVRQKKKKRREIE